MTAKEYLEQAQRLSQDIDSKLEQIRMLRELAAKATAVISDMPGSATRNTTRMEDAVLKIVAQEEAINREIERLVDIRAEIAEAIQTVPDHEERKVLELRYLCYKSWQEIAEGMNLSERHIYRLHRQALKKVPVAAAAN